jgi:hypothetical protein
MENLQKIFDFLSRYPPWVIAASIASLALSIGLLIVFRPKPETPTSNNCHQATFDKNTALLLVSTSSPTESDVETVRQSWGGPVIAINQTKKEDFINAIKQGYPILHLEAKIGIDYVEFEDGRLTAAQLNELLSTDLSKTDLVVLSACQSFRVGKALEDSKVKYSIVARPNLRADIARSFFNEFYKQLAAGADVEAAYKRAIVDVSARRNVDGKEILTLTRYAK